MNWYGKEHLQPKYTKKLVKKWDAPPGNTATHYYDLFPALYPKHLPDDHYIVKYDESLYPTNRDYRDNFKIKKLLSFFILKFYHSNGRRTLILRKL